MYLSPIDIENAAALLEINVDEFIQQYASHIMSLDFDRNHNQTWVRLQEYEDGDNMPSCVFLDPATNYCRIYQARPGMCNDHLEFACCICYIIIV